MRAQTSPSIGPPYSRGRVSARHQCICKGSKCQVVRALGETRETDTYGRQPVFGGNEVLHHLEGAPRSGQIFTQVSPLLAS